MGLGSRDSADMDWYLKNITPEVGGQFQKMCRIIPLAPNHLPKEIQIKIQFIVEQEIIQQAITEPVKPPKVYAHVTVTGRAPLSVAEDLSDKAIVSAVQSDPSSLPVSFVEQSSSIQPSSALSLQNQTPPARKTKVDAAFLLHSVSVLNTKWLELIEGILQDTELKGKMKMLSELKDALVEYTKIIDKILIYYQLPLPGASELPEVLVVNNGKRKINEVIKKLTVSKLKELLPCEIVLTEEDFLCEILGVNMEVNKHLMNIPAEFRSHEPDEYYIKSFVLETLNYLDDSTQENTSECLRKCGFTESRAEYLADLLKMRGPLDQQPLSYWVERYIEDMFKYDTLICCLTKRYPYGNEDSIGWFTQEVNRDVDDDGESVNAMHLQILNMSGTMDTVSDDEKKFVEHDTSKQFWFHGTDHDSAVNIIEEGIQLRRGKAQQDFSDDDGFYLSENFTNVKKWAWNSRRPAVIIFKKEVSLDQYSGMNLNEDHEEWKAVVRHNRSGQSRRMMPPADIKKRFDESQFVYGPRCTNGGLGTRITRTTDTWEPLGFEAPSDRQLCIKSDEMAENFGAISNIEGVIFY